MMKAAFPAFALSMALLPIAVQRAQSAPAIVQETQSEFFASEDFNKDGRQDMVIVDKDTGKYRLGYLETSGLFNWVDCRPTGIKGITGFSIGSVLNPEVPGLVFTSPDANQFALVEAASPTSPPKPSLISFEDALGPNTIVAIDIGGAGNTPLADLYVGSIYNSPEENLATLLRNSSGNVEKLADTPLKGPFVRAVRLSLKDKGQPVVCGILKGSDGATFVAEDMASGKAVRVLELAGLSSNSEFAAGKLLGGEGLDLAFYTPGESKVSVRSVTVAGGKYAFGKEIVCDAGGPVKHLSIVGGSLLAVLGEGEKAILQQVVEGQGSKPLQTIVATNYLITSAVEYPGGLVVFSKPPTSKFSTRYFLYRASGKTFEAGPYGSLATLADNDNITIPDIHERIVEKSKASSEAEMQVYTNTIPGTRVAYAMVPIRGGEFLMGSPETEADRNADEGPQVKVKISPFWMGRCEVTWSEYELFMYPDEEKRSRTSVPTDAAGDKLADAVTHPSRPYVEMSFGMGKEGFPAISMTQHAANKYCQWLSAKTGEFYRLPTEAEWEYACRAGTTTKYYFGEDDSQLPKHGWFEQNSDFKYQKVGKKLPNPWGLHDMYGNVVEWVLDQYDPEFYKALSSKGGVIIDPWNKATKPYPHAVRGGSWDDEARRLRSGARRGSDRAWKMQDPQLPKSIWYFSDAQFVGFRVVRPLKVPSAEEMQKYWSSGVERD